MVRVCGVAELPCGESLRVVVDGLAVAVFHTEAGLFAIDDTCTHQDASLSEGWLQGCMVECPLHASAFDLRTGEPTAPPARRAVRTHPVHLRDEAVYVEVAAGGPA